MSIAGRDEVPPPRLCKKLARGAISSCMGGQQALFPVSTPREEKREKAAQGDPLRRFLL
jgi:hypothetical protein